MTGFGSPAARSARNTRISRLLSVTPCPRSSTNCLSILRAPTCFMRHRIFGSETWQVGQKAVTLPFFWYVT